MFHRLALLGMIAVSQSVQAQQSCEKLAELKLPHTEITSAAALPAGPMPGGNPSAKPVELPARCVVKAIARPTSDSEIKIEVWLPATGWNGKYLQSGNGGWAGSIPTSTLATFIQRGYAAAGTDDGHSNSAGGGPAGWAVGHPEKLIDFGHRALHETGNLAKAVIRAYYEKPPSRNYFFGCSDGGREALMEAQRYPEDFDGIIAGAPANDWSNHFAGFVWNEQALTKSPESAIPAEKLPAIQKAVLAACDANDGVKDGLIQDPRTCHFDPGVLACKGGDTAECLTEPQLAALEKIYSGPKNERTGQQIYPGYPPGHEAIPGAWRPWIITTPPQQSPQSQFGNSYFGQAVFEDAGWDYRKLNFDSDIAFAAEKGGVVVASNSPDLRSFRAHGGKMIQYHGWADAAISPYGSINYYEKVRSFLSRFPDPRAKDPEIASFYRLFLVPGMGHCAGGIGPNSFGNAGNQFVGDPERDLLTALDRWVEQGVAPERFIGTGRATGSPDTVLTRPLCSYPQVVRYNGSGDPNQASSFACVAPPQPQ
ncbi:MAG: tannase/feruloyl esterase family alpha/beta hydrolase [Paludibaculum sp.]